MGNSRFSEGLLIGMLIGGAAVFLLGTKKGNKILKTITEEGLDGLTDVVQRLENEVEGLEPSPAVHKRTKTEIKKEEVADLEKDPVLDIDHVEDRIELEPVNPESNGNSRNVSKRFFKRKT